jgi:hypothetical protein
MEIARMVQAEFAEVAPGQYFSTSISVSPRQLSFLRFICHPGLVQWAICRCNTKNLVSPRPNNKKYYCSLHSRKCGNHSL